MKRVTMSGEPTMKRVTMYLCAGRSQNLDESAAKLGLYFLTTPAIHE
jgi:hypothetical protein